jgi:hypothetical protein
VFNNPAALLLLLENIAVIAQNLHKVNFFGIVSGREATTNGAL